MQKHLENIDVSLNKINDKASYLDILSYLLKDYNENTDELVNYIQQKLQCWNKNYQLSLNVLLPQLVNINDIVKGRHSVLAFRALVSKLDTWKGSGVEYAYALFENEIKKWPLKFRCAPWSWGAGLTDDEPKPFWNLVACRQLHPYFFYHSCYAPPADIIIRLPLAAQNRLQLLSGISTNCSFKEPDELSLRDRWSKESFKKLMSSNKNKHITKLSIDSPPGYLPKEAEDIVTTLIDTGHLEKLKAFALNGYGYSMTLEAISLLASANTPQLEELSLKGYISSSNKNHHQFIQTLCEGNFPSLKKLNIALSNINDMDLQYIINSEWFPNLEELNLSYNNINDEGLKYFNQYGKSSSLRKIDLSQNNITAEGIPYLLNAKAATNLWSLKLKGLGDEDYIDNKVTVNEIASSTLNCLVELIMWEEYNSSVSHKFSSETAKKIANSPAFSLLDSLFIGYVDWVNACDGHGPEPWPCFEEKAINILRNSSILRSSAKNELILLNERHHTDYEDFF